VARAISGHSTPDSSLAILSCRIQCWVSAGKNLFLPDMSLNQFKLKKILVQWYLLCHSNMISSVSYKPNTEIQLCILNAVENCASVRLR